jgi:hypothetical protein
MMHKKNLMIFQYWNSGALEFCFFRPKNRSTEKHLIFLNRF